MSIHRLVRPLVLALMLMSIPALSFGGVFVSVSVGPPPIPVYTQPLCPGPGYIWTPGYWAYGDQGYYWVPGTWVMAPQPGFLWTPGYWGWSGGVYLWHGGYWGPHVGFYGGINYGFGYGGVGFVGGEWRGDHFFYNRSVTNVNVTNVTNVYNKTVIVNNNTHVSYNGGNGGVHAQPSAQEQRWAGERHMEPTRDQQQHFQQAAHNPQLLAKNNGGRPSIAATARPADFHSAVGARAAGGPVNRASLTANAHNMPAAHNVPRPPNAGNNAQNSRNSYGGASNGRNMGRSNTYSQPHANTAMNAPRNNYSQQRNAPSRSYSAPQHNSAPAQHSAPEPHGGHAHR